MTRDKEKAADAWQGIDGNETETQLPSKETLMKIVSPTVSHTTDSDWIVTTDAGFIVKPDSLMMRSLCNADEARAGTTERARYFVNAGE